MRRRVHVLLGGLLLIAGCADTGSPTPAAPTTTSVATPESPPPSTTRPVTTTSSPSVPDPSTPTSTPTTQPSTTTSPADGPIVPPVSLLVVDHEGAWVWSSSGTRELVVSGAIASAIPDRVGGVVFQRAETGGWRPDHDLASPGTASWRWVGDGTGESILRLRRSGGRAEVVVEAPADGTVELVDTAIVGGRPALAYLRTRYFTITASDGRGPWWESAVAELVIRDLKTGDERVVRAQEVGWEHDIRSPSLGAEAAAEAIEAYGDGPDWVELRDFDGSLIEVGYRLPFCEPGCQLVADLAPTGAWLATARSDHIGDGRVEVVALDHRTGVEQIRATIPVPEWTSLVVVDTADELTLVVTSAWNEAADLPQLARGDEGGWVQRLQTLLSRDETYLVPDGVFGPRTEAAVRALQTAAGHPPTGVVDTATWALLGGPYRLLNDPLLLDSGGSLRELDVLQRATPLVFSGNAPRITLWSGPMWTADPDPVAEIVLRPGGLGPYDFGVPGADVERWLTDSLGPAEPAEGLLYPCARWGCAVERHLRWPSAGLQVGFADRTTTGDVVAEPIMLAWTVSFDPWYPGNVDWPPLDSESDVPDLEFTLLTERGVGLGSTVAELESAQPSTVLLAWSHSTFMPAGFYVPDAGGDAVLTGDVNWSVVAAMQAALNERGADLVVDGIAGPATRGAIADFQSSRGLEPGELEATLDELGLVGPHAATRVVRLSAGTWFWELGDPFALLIG